MTARTRATLVPGLAGAIELVQGDNHTCARLATGAVSCWGLNGEWQLGDGTTTASSASLVVVRPPTGLVGEHA